MKNIMIILSAFIIFSCSSNSRYQNSGSDGSEQAQETSTTILLKLPPSLETRRAEFSGYLNDAINNINTFAEHHGWSHLVKEVFMDSVIIFDDKNQFNLNLLILAGADTAYELPDTYCAALEKRTLLAVSPELYTKVYPEGVEEQSYTKLLTHEIAHQLHVRILNGDEEAMGPIWFYEGFATFAADQFSDSDIQLSQAEMKRIMAEPERGSYLKYNYVFRYFESKIGLKELINNAKKEDFNESLISLLN